MAKFNLLAVIAVFCFSFTVSADNNLHYTLSIAGASDDNISRAETSANIAEDKLVELGFSVLHMTALGGDKTLSTGLLASSTHHDEIEGLDHVDLGGSLAFSFKTADSIKAPLISFSLTAKQQNYDVVQRDGVRVTAAAGLTRRLNQSSSLELGFRQNYRDTEGTVFDTRDEQLFVNYSYVFEMQLLATVSYTFMTGDFISTSQPNSLKIINGSDELEIDNAFDGWKNSQVAYRIPGDANIFDLALNYPLGDSLFIEASGQFIDVEAEENNEYERTIARLSLIKEF